MDDNRWPSKRRLSPWNAMYGMNLLHLRRLLAETVQPVCHELGDGKSFSKAKTKAISINKKD